MNQIPFKTERGNYLAQEVSPQSVEFVIVSNYLCGGNNSGHANFKAELPKGSWSIVGAVKDITEGQAREIVDETDNPFWIGQGLKYIDFTSDTKCFETALDSFKSLLKANGIDQDKHFIILKEKI